MYYDSQFGNIEKKTPYIVNELKQAFPTYTDKQIKKILKSICKADYVCSRSGGKKSPFANLIVKWVVNRTAVLPEDEKIIAETLKTFNTLANQYPELRKVKAKTFKSPGDMRELISKYVKDESETMEYDKYDFLEKLFDYKGFSAYVVKNWREGKKAFADSGWCVRYKSEFENHGAPFFMVTKGNKRILLYHIPTGQIMDVHNRPIEIGPIEPPSLK